MILKRTVLVVTLRSTVLVTRKKTGVKWLECRGKPCRLVKEGGFM